MNEMQIYVCLKGGNYVIFQLPDRQVAGVCAALLESVRDNRDLVHETNPRADAVADRIITVGQCAVLTSEIAGWYLKPVTDDPLVEVQQRIANTLEKDIDSGEEWK